MQSGGPRRCAATTPAGAPGRPRAGRGLYSSDEPTWLARLGAEVPNLRAGVTWAASTGDVDTAMRIGASFPRQAVERPLLGAAFLAEQAMQTPGAENHESAGVRPQRGGVGPHQPWRRRRWCADAA